MRRLVLLVLAGCSFQAHSATSDAMRDVAIDMPSDDIDGDGVPNESDNCPTMANADQRDHDGDGRGDVCDLCPHIAEASDTDTDGDGVGNACDPRPGMPGDHRAFWDGFYDMADLANWPVNGSYSVSGGRLLIGSTTMPLQYTFPNVQFMNAYAVTSVHVTTIGAAAMNPSIQMQNGDNSVDHAYWCTVAVTATGNTATAYGFWPSQPGMTTSVAWPGSVNTNFTIADELDGSAHTCTVAQPGSFAQPATAAGPHGGLVLLGAQYAGAAYDYLFVVEVGP